MQGSTLASAAPASANAATTLAFERTCLAYERTQMAWVRTSLSLISFGFTISKFFQSANLQLHSALGPRSVGMLMILIGVFSMIISDIQYRQSMTRIQAVYGSAPAGLAGKVSVLISVLGMLALAVAMVRN